MTAHLNFCRQAMQSFVKHIALFEGDDLTDEHQAVIGWMARSIGISVLAQKFILPEDGIACKDKNYRALESVDKLSLPYENICLEFQRTIEFPLPEGHFKSTKAVVLAVSDDDWITVLPCVWMDDSSNWSPMPSCKIPRVGAIQRDTDSNYTGISVSREAMPPGVEPPLDEDYASEIHALLSFLNALACSNVRLARSPANRRRQKAKKGASPFDSYWILEIVMSKTARQLYHGGSHASPREHLRRGHIRRLHDGRHIWINSMVVAAGSEAGKVEKDYAMKETA